MHVIILLFRLDRHDLAASWFSRFLCYNLNYLSHSLFHSLYTTTSSATGYQMVRFRKYHIPGRLIVLLLYKIALTLCFITIKLCQHFPAAHQQRIETFCSQMIIIHCGFITFRGLNEKCENTKIYVLRCVIPRDVNSINGYNLNVLVFGTKWIWIYRCSSNVAQTPIWFS